MTDSIDLSSHAPELTEEVTSYAHYQLYTQLSWRNKDPHRPQLPEWVPGGEGRAWSLRGDKSGHIN
jgi:hypothetical protein